MSTGRLRDQLTNLAGKWTRIEDVGILLKMDKFQPAMLVYWRLHVLFHIHLSHEKNPRILSMKYWLVNDGILKMLYEIIPT